MAEVSVWEGGRKGDGGAGLNWVRRLGGDDVRYNKTPINTVKSDAQSSFAVLILASTAGQVLGFL